MAFYAPHGLRRRYTQNDWVSNEWIDAHDESDQFERPRQDADRRYLRNELDRFFVELYRGFFVVGQDITIKIHPASEKYLVLFNRTFIIDKNGSLTDYDFDDMFCFQDSMCEEIHGDYPVVWAKFHWLGSEIELRCELFREYFTFTVYASHIDQCSALTKDVEKLRDIALNGGTFEEKQSLNRSFYQIFWRRFESYIKEKNKSISLMSDSLVFGNIFGDFRGIILPVWEEKTSNELPEISMHSDWGSSVAENLLDFVTERSSYECSASYMVGGKSIYMTDLGQRRIGLSSERIPIVYLICLKGMNHGNLATSKFFLNKWELGRLVDRLHFLGTVRLASMRDLTLLRHASRKLAAYEPVMKDAQQDLSFVSVEAARQHFHSISRDFLIDDTTKQGIQYRIERSRYYKSRFKNNIKFLDICEIEGYQPYDQFVERRIGSVLDMIDRVGIRYERAGKALSLLDQTYTDRNLENIQEWADLALIGFLIPYYSFSLFSHVMPNEACVLRHWAMLTWFLAYIYGSFRFVGLSRRISVEKFLQFLILIGGFLLFFFIISIAGGDFAAMINEPVGWLKSHNCPAHPTPQH